MDPVVDMTTAIPLKLTQFKAVIFDLDGTLVDSVPDLTLAMNHALNELSLQFVTTEQVRLWVGNGSRKLVERSLHAQDIHDETLLDRLHKTFLVSYKGFLCSESVLYPGVADLLQQLSDNAIPMGLVTNKPIEFVPELLEALNIKDYFKLLIGGNSLPEKKPSPMPLIHIAKELGENVEDCLMVGDSSSDVKSAQGASMPCVLLQQGYNQGQDLNLLKADWLLADIVQLHGLLGLF